MKAQQKKLKWNYLLLLLRLSILDLWMEILVEMDGQIKVDDDNLPVLENVPTGDIWHTDEVFLE